MRLYKNIERACGSGMIETRDFPKVRLVSKFIILANKYFTLQEVRLRLRLGKQKARNCQFRIT